MLLVEICYGKSATRGKGRLMSYRTKMILPVVGMLLLFVCALLAVVREAEGASASSSAANAGRAVGFVAPPLTPFDGGTFEASGVAHVPGTDGVLFVDDGRWEEIFWMRV